MHLVINNKTFRIPRHCERSAAISLVWRQTVKDCRAALAMTGIIIVSRLGSVAISYKLFNEVH